MKLTVTKPTEIEASIIRIVASVNYGEEDIPNNFPLRVGDTWTASVAIDTGKILDWPESAYGKKWEFAMKVTDSGCYYLLGGEYPHLKELAKLENDYVPSCVPGEYGDYIDLKIGADGVIKNWHVNSKNIRQSFFRNDND